MGLRGRLFAFAYERTMPASEDAGLADMRRDLIAQASGDVLEVGAGTGLNLPHYPRSITSLTLSEPEAAMLRRLERAAAASPWAPVVVRAPAEQLPFADGSFDTVVVTLTLCTVSDLAAALGEAHRVLRPAGRLLFLEHVRSDDADLARRQDRMFRINHFVGYGCHCNRRTLDAIAANGFTLGEVVHGELPKAASWLRPLIVGSATAA